MFDEAAHMNEAHAKYRQVLRINPMNIITKILMEKSNDRGMIVRINGSGRIYTRNIINYRSRDIKPEIFAKSDKYIHTNNQKQQRTKVTTERREEYLKYIYRVRAAIHGVELLYSSRRRVTKAGAIGFLNFSDDSYNTIDNNRVEVLNSSRRHITKIGRNSYIVDMNKPDNKYDKKEVKVLNSSRRRITKADVTGFLEFVDEPYITVDYNKETDNIHQNIKHKRKSHELPTIDAYLRQDQEAVTPDDPQDSVEETLLCHSI